MARKNNHSTMPRAIAARDRSVSDFVKHMGSMGVSTDAAMLQNLTAAASLPQRGRTLARSAADDSTALPDEGGKLLATQVRRDRSSLARDQGKRAASRSRDPSADGLRDAEALSKATKLGKQQQFKRNKFGHASESDRRIPTKMPKHLFSGKRGNGKTDRR